MNHKWDNKGYSKVKTCTICGTKYFNSHYVYKRPYSEENFFDAGDCNQIAKLSNSFQNKVKDTAWSLAEEYTKGMEGEAKDKAMTDFFNGYMAAVKNLNKEETK